MEAFPLGVKVTVYSLFFSKVMVWIPFSSEVQVSFAVPSVAVAVTVKRADSILVTLVLWDVLNHAQLTPHRHTQQRTMPTKDGANIWYRPSTRFFSAKCLGL